MATDQARVEFRLLTGKVSLMFCLDYSSDISNSISCLGEKFTTIFEMGIHSSCEYIS